MYRTILSIIAILTLINTANANETSKLIANFKRVGVDFYSSDLQYGKNKNSNNTLNSTDNQTVAGAMFDFALEYHQEKYRWDNSIYAAYGRAINHTYNKERDKKENEDQISLKSEYMHKVWRVETFDANVGPMASVGHISEFTKHHGVRKELTRLRAGAKLFDGTILDSLYVAGVYEYDTTHDSHDKTAWEIGGKIKYYFNKDTNFEIEGHYRDYMSYSAYQGSDQKYNAAVSAKLNIQTNAIVTVTPFMAYKVSEARKSKTTDSNIIFGVSIAYIDKIKIW